VTTLRRDPWFLAGILVLWLSATPSGPAQDQTSAVPPPLTTGVLDNMESLPGGLAALPPRSIPLGTPQTTAKIELGRKLFFDNRLSLDNTMSCSTCHDPRMAYSDGRRRAIGLYQTALSRRTPSLLNVAFNPIQFWDGRAKTLEDQVLVPTFTKNEMGMSSRKALVNRLEQDPEYRLQFQEIFGRETNLPDIQQAIAAFERTLVTPNSAFDRYASGDKSALTEPQKRGLLLFIGKAACSQCHNGPNFTDNKFHNLGRLPGSNQNPDPGRFAITGNAADRNAFKTPSLRSSTQQNYFMHNGSFASLADVIKFYDRGGGVRPKSNLLFKLDLSHEEQQDLLAFLESLSAPVPQVEPFEVQ
jgi:cytochrome c peroxidase